jgi:hypothetical protein
LSLLKITADTPLQWVFSNNQTIACFAASVASPFYYEIYAQSHREFQERFHHFLAVRIRTSLSIHYGVQNSAHVLLVPKLRNHVNPNNGYARQFVFGLMPNKKRSAATLSAGVSAKCSNRSALINRGRKWAAPI